jgi:hypothetical protein
MYESPYDILGLNYSSTEKEITKRCRDLKAKNHPDAKAGNADEFIRINNACQEIQNHTPDTQTMEGTPQWNPFEHVNSNNTDGCARVGQVCTCPTTGQEGFCHYGEEQPGLHCDCERPFARTNKPSTDYSEKPKKSKKKNGNNAHNEEWREFIKNFFQKYDRHNYYKFHNEHPTQEQIRLQHIAIQLFSRAIQAPIYNLPLQQSMMPPYISEDDDVKWLFSAAPFIKTPTTAFDDHFREKEAGALLAWRLSKGTIWVDLYTSFAALHSNCVSSHSSFTKTDIGITDILLTLGTALTINNFDFWIKGLFGASTHSNKDQELKHEVPLLLPHASFGIQGDCAWVLAETRSSQHALRVTLRDLYFIHTKVELKKASIPRTTFEVRPGNYIDLLIGLHQRFGSDWEHKTEIGYDATFRTGQKVSMIGIPIPGVIIKPHLQDEPSVRHTLYGSYTYDFNMGRLPISWGLGVSWTIMPTHYNAQHNALFWMNLGFPY